MEYQKILSKTTTIQGIGFFLFAGLVCVLQYYRLNHLAPPPENIWDNVYLWEWARNFYYGDFASFVNDSHHQLRWGNWGFAALLIEFFSDEILFYYLATIIPSTLAILIFTYLAWKYIGWFGALIFIVLWFFDALLFRASFQLLPSGAALLPLAILFTLCCHVVEKERVTLPIITAIAITVFWLYGSKETYLAFFPAVLWILGKYGGLRTILLLASILAIAYILETVFFHYISGDFSLFGRIHALTNDGQHLKLMTEETRYVARQTRYFDSGITMRWTLTSGVTSIPIFIGFIFSLLAITNNSRHAPATTTQSSHKFIGVLAAFIISFIVFTTFFIVSINPIRLGHPLVPRYVTILMPLIYIMVIAYLAQQTKLSSWVTKLGLIAIIPFFIAPSIERYSNYPDLSIFRISDDYNRFGKKLGSYDCVRGKGISIVMNQLDLIPFKYRTPKVLKLIENDNTITQPPWYVVKSNANQTCRRTYTIHHLEKMRY